jgi:hypothetical protein
MALGRRNEFVILVAAGDVKVDLVIRGACWHVRKSPKQRPLPHPTALSPIPSLSLSMAAYAACISVPYTPRDTAHTSARSTGGTSMRASSSMRAAVAGYLEMNERGNSTKPVAPKKESVPSEQAAEHV